MEETWTNGETELNQESHLKNEGLGFTVPPSILKNLSAQGTSKHKHGINSNTMHLL